MTFKPPSHSFSKAADSVIQTVCPRNILPIGKLTVKYLIQIFFEISHKYLAAFPRKDTIDGLLFLLQVVQYMCDSVLESAVMRKIVILFR